jgi:hypothetical protein
MGRRKHFQDEANRKEFEFEPGRMYVADFGNPYLVESRKTDREIYYDW